MPKNTEVSESFLALEAKYMKMLEEQPPRAGEPKDAQGLPVETLIGLAGQVAQNYTPSGIITPEVLEMNLEENR